MSEWREYKLDDIAQLVKDSWKVGDEKLPYIALEHIVESGLRLQGIGDSNTIASNKYRFNSDSFLFGKLRPYFRKLYRPDFEGICSTDIWVVKPKDKNNKDYLFYFFANKEFVDFTYSGSSGTRMPRADWNFVSQAEWMFPDPAEQKAIAEVLSSLDDKTDLLHRQNKTLEQMAETLFRQWFVEEAGEDWEETTLGDISHFKNGKSRPKDEGNYPIYGGNGVLGFANEFNAENESIVIGRVGAYCGSLYFENQNIWVSDNAIIGKAKNENYLYFIFYFLKSMNLNDLAEGSSHPLLTQTLLNKIILQKPPISKVGQFNIQIGNYFRKKESNQK